MENYQKNVAFNCLFLDEKNEVSVFTPEILSNGSFVGSWPEGFFEESLSELYDWLILYKFNIVIWGKTKR